MVFAKNVLTLLTAQISAEKDFGTKQHDSQSGRDAALLATVSTWYCISLTHFKLEVALS